MNNCAHVSSVVIDSGKPGTKGRALPSYPCLMVRRRRCTDCGEKFSTVEVPKEYMKQVAMQKKFMRLVLEFLENYKEEEK